MKYLKLLLIVLLTVSAVSAQNKPKVQPKNQVQKNMKTEDDSVSYSIGQSIGHNLKDPAMNIALDLVIKGMKDAFEGKSDLTSEQMQTVMNAFNQKMMARKAQDTKQAAEKNKKLGQEFLNSNKGKEGVVTTASGMQYKILVKGTGTVSPKDTSKVKVHYKGTLLDGREFDSSYKRGEPAEFPLNQVIKGWTEAVQLMHVGDKYQMWIPSDLAYGDEGRSELIQPGTLLVFEVELLEIGK